MSDTPRTDARVRRIMDNDGSATDLESFTRQLERELYAANERVKRLEEAGDAMYHYCDSASRFGWKQAKEIKP